MRQRKQLGFRTPTDKIGVNDLYKREGRCSEFHSMKTDQRINGPSDWRRESPAPVKEVVR